MDPLAVFFGAVFVFGTLLLYTFVWGAGYQPVPRRSLEKMIEYARPGEGDLVYDLGSGFGRIVLEVAEKRGARCVGVELDPIRCWWSRLSARRKGLQDKVSIVRKNLLSVGVSDADVMFLFLSPLLMDKVEEKLLRELKKGSRIVSYSHQFRGWAPTAMDRETNVYLYTA